MSGLNIVIVAPSGTGKSSLIKRVMEKYPQIEWSVSCTTRPIREGEIHGKDYFFLTKEEFEANLDDGRFIEWAKVHSNYYGTSKKFAEEGLKEGRKLLYDLDVQGADQMKEIFKEKAQVIFIEPPSVETLERRLKGRGTDSADVINERLSNAKRELLRKNDYDYLVKNDDFEQAVNDLIKVFGEILG